MKPALIIVALIALAALLVPPLLPYDHIAIDWDSVRVGLVTVGQPLCTDDLGRGRLARAALLRGALAQIGDRCRRFLTAIYLEEPPASYEEICRREGLPLGSIGPTRGRCLEKLRKALADLPEFAPAKDLPAQVSDPPRAPSTKQPPEPGGARSRRRGRSG